MQKSEYLPGFDWLKIIGAIMVVMAHNGVFKSYKSDYLTYYRMTNIVIPLYFFISGYLCGRKADQIKSRVKKQVLKYGAIYLLIELALVTSDHISAFRTSGDFGAARFLVDFLRCFVACHGSAYQLWFIPALLYPMILNAFLNEKTRRIVIAVSMVLLFATQYSSPVDMQRVFRKLITFFPAIGKVFTATKLRDIWIHACEGTCFTTIGFALNNRRFRLRCLFIAVVFAMVFERYVQFIGISRILYSLLVFEIAVQAPGQFLRAYHTESTFFFLTMFLLHVFELELINRGPIKAVAVKILLIIAINILITLIFSFCRKELQKRRLGEVGNTENGFQQNTVQNSEQL